MDRNPTGEHAPPPPARRKQGDELLLDAEAYCRDHGLRLTRGRRQVLAMLASSGTMVKAYDLLERMTTPGRKAMPPVVYRALDFWIEHGFVHRIESLNGFFACGHPLHNHGCQLLICNACARTVEVCDGELRRHFAHTAEGHGFHYTHSVLEIHGLCASCAATEGEEQRNPQQAGCSCAQREHAEKDEANE